MSSPETYDLGDQPEFAATFEVDGNATDPSVVKFKFRTPAGVETTYTYGVDAEVIRDSLGHFHVDLLLDAAGVWIIRWVSAGTCTSADEYRVRVEPSAFASPLA